MAKAFDKKLMEIALKLAEKGKGNVSPNPMVGAVIAKNGKIAGKGFHEKFGSNHAEVNAIKNAGKKAETTDGPADKQRRHNALHTLDLEARNKLGQTFLLISVNCVICLFFCEILNNPEL